MNNDRGKLEVGGKGEGDEGRVVDKNEEKKRSYETIKITINKETEVKLLELLSKVNEGFINGKVSRQDLANWIVMKLCLDCDDSLVENIRADHFDEIMYFESVLKKSKELGTLPPEYQALIRQQFGTSNKGKNRRALTKDIHQ